MVKIIHNKVNKQCTAKTLSILSEHLAKVYSKISKNVTVAIWVEDNIVYAKIENL